MYDNKTYFYRQPKINKMPLLLFLLSLSTLFFSISNIMEKINILKDINIKRYVKGCQKDAE